jgi:cytoskeletal protein CcmA (bactofilin family)
LSNSSIDGSLAVESMQGVLSVGGAVGGSIVAGTVDGKAQISVGTNITSSGRIEVTGDLSGDITTNGDVAGEVYVAGNMVYGSSISATGDLTGVIRSDGDCEGDASVAGDVTGDIKVGQLLSRGRVLMDSSCQGMVSIIKKTASSSLIQAAKGLTSTGRIEVNAIGGAHDHDGVIFLGKATSSDPVSIAGQILLLAGTGGGDNNGMINVKGCLTPGTLNLCIGGSNNGSVNISNVCPGTVNWACSGPGQ